MTNKVKEHIGSYYLFLKNAAVYFDCFGVGYIPEELLNKIKNKYIRYNMFTIQSDDYIMCEFYSIAFVEYINAEKTLFNIPIYFFKMAIKMNNDKIIYRYFKG